MDGVTQELAMRVAARFAELPQVEAVALTGSQMMGIADASSDIDLYIYIREDIPLEDRMRVATPYAEGAEFNVRFWGTEDFWHDQPTDLRVEAIYWWVSWLEGEIERVLRHSGASTGYTTAFLHSLRNGRILFDRNGWLHELQVEAHQPYPEALRQAIFAKNYPILRRVSSSYVQQLKSALRRGDVVSLNHRVTALLASYFDILFALNRVMHPGEKRLLVYAEMLCPKRPARLSEQVSGLIASIPDGDVIAQANALIDGLDELLIAEGYDTARL